jgi:hypothetical protein
MPLSEEHVECWGRIVESAREEHDRRAAILGVVQRWDDVTILAVDAELSRLRAVAEAARALRRSVHLDGGRCRLSPLALEALDVALAALDGQPTTQAEGE